MDAACTPAPAPRPAPGRPARLAALLNSLFASSALAHVNARACRLEAVRRALEDRDAAFLPEDFAAIQAEAAKVEPLERT